MNSYLHSFGILLLMLGLDGCTRPAPVPSTRSDTYRPVYASYAEIRTIQVLAPQPMRSAGKIYVKDNYLFINEENNGIHVVDNRDPANPVPIAFLSIPGNHELAIKDSTLYADNVMDLVAINIANPRNVRVVKRLENVFDYPAFPAMVNVRFECPDRDKGVVIRWEKANVDNPQCFR